MYANYFLSRLENLAWATAQVHCYCSSTNDEKTTESTANKSVVKAAIVTADTALNTQQGQGNVVLETKPKILFCDLRLSPGETRSCRSHSHQAHLYGCIHIKMKSIDFLCFSKRSFQGNSSNVRSTDVSRY